MHATQSTPRPTIRGVRPGRARPRGPQHHSNGAPRPIAARATPHLFFSSCCASSPPVSLSFPLSLQPSSASYACCVGLSYGSLRLPARLCTRTTRRSAGVSADPDSAGAGLRLSRRRLPVSRSMEDVGSARAPDAASSPDGPAAVAAVAVAALPRRRGEKHATDRDRLRDVYMWVSGEGPCGSH